MRKGPYGGESTNHHAWRLLKGDQANNLLRLRLFFRKRLSRFSLHVLVTLIGMLIGIFLMVGDEIIGFIAPSRQLIMHWPLGLQFTIWQSWEIVFVIILLGTIFYIMLIEYLLKEIDELRLGHSTNN
jgi:hypothetical protein